MAKSLSHTTSEELTLSSRGYRLSKRLGEGSYAKVYLSEYRENQSPDTKPKQLACKIVDTSKAPRDFVKKFLPRELELLVKLGHPHIIHVHSIFQRKLKYYIFMRFAENGDLLDFILKKGPISEPQSRVWLRQLCLAIQYLHDMDIAHRDLKCENILITNNYNIKLADFGFARYVIDLYGKRMASETYCGSLSYAAPDILKGTPYHPKIADMWSIGIILYIMLNKAMPFDDNNIKRLYEQQMNRKWKLRSKVIDNLSEQVKHLINHLLEPDISRRWKIEQVLSSEWFGMDPRLLRLNSAEQAAIIQAQVERKKYLENINKKVDKAIDDNREEITVLKEHPGHAAEKKGLHNSIQTILE